jgi:hypothetical protein
MRIVPNIDLKATETRVALVALAFAAVLGVALGICALLVMAP